MGSLVEIEELLKNNEPPSDLLTQELNEMLANPLQDLETLDSEISSLETHLKDLKIKRKQVQERVIRYNTILSPIRRIPSDILHEIFYRCLPTGRNAIMSATESPVLLTRVCSTWRRTALSSPRLWARLHIPLLDVDDYVLPGGAKEEDNDNDGLYKQRRQQIQVLKLRCAVVKEWLSRSGMCPLSISIHCQLYDTSDSSENATSELLHTLAAYSRRWRELEAVVPFGLYIKLDRMVVAEELTTLTALRVDFQSQEWYGRLKSQPSLSILNAPNLKSVSMVDRNKDIWRFPTTILAWSKITDFYCHPSVSPKNIVILFQNCPNLVCVRIHISTHYGRSFSINEVVGDDQGSISLPHLRTLFVSEQASNAYWTHLRNLYKCIEVPGLREITYGSHGSYRQEIPIVYLLQKSTNLEKLTFDPIYFSVDDTHIIFRSVPGVTHLVVDALPYRNASLSAHDWRVNRADFLRVFMTSDGGDPVDDGETDLPMNINTDIPLLPRLESLRIRPSWGMTTDTSDEKIQNFILSRIGPSFGAAQSILVAGYRTAILKRVSIAFLRPKQIEIADVIYRHAERNGVDLELELIYPPEEDVKKEENRLSLSAGCGIRDDSLWRFVDKEDVDF